MKFGRQLLLNAKNIVSGGPSHQTGGSDYLQLVDSKGGRHDTYIDVVGREGGLMVVLGWSSAADLEVSLGTGARLEVSRHRRPDVSEALGLPEDRLLGFAALCPLGDSDQQPELIFELPGGCEERLPRQAEVELDDHHRQKIPNLLARASDAVARLRACDPKSPIWRDAIAALPKDKANASGCLGYIEGALLSPEGGGVIYGWAAHPDDAAVWIEVETPTLSFQPLHAGFRRSRRDVRKAFPSHPWVDGETGFLLYVPELSPDAILRLCVATRSGVGLLAQHNGSELLSQDPRLAAEKLFALETEPQDFHRRVNHVDWPVLAPLIAQHSAAAQRLATPRHDFGEQPSAPEVSIIVPLYHRFDFMEHQLVEFSRDPEVLHACELIYVVDDPEIEAAVLAASEYHHRLFSMPFSVILGRCNRGFSGANNLGARFARGQELLFLNSDVIPRAPGWLGVLRSSLRREGVGLVGPRLLFPGGGLQHAGMAFDWLSTLGIWINRHPLAGLSPETDTDGARAVPAVTGACMLMRRAVFDAVGGWDSGYLIGDFEDSDLCLSLRNAGWQIFYEPASVLTHLERQSFVGIGQDYFKQRVVIANAVRHQSRWSELLASPFLCKSTIRAKQEEAA